MPDIVPLITSYAVKIVGVLVALYIAKMVANWVGDMVGKTLRARSFDETLTSFFSRAANWGVLVMAVLSCLGVFGIETTSFAAVIGAAGLAVGLAFQGTLANFAAGVMLLVFRPFKIGDRVTLPTVPDAFVAEISLFTTSFDTPDHRRLTVPNSAVFGSVIDNTTGNDIRRVDINVGAAYDATIDDTRKALEAAAASLPFSIEGRAHEVFLAGLGGSSVDWQMRIWCKTSEYWDCYQATIRATKMHMEEAGIGIPYTTLDVNITSGSVSG